MAANRNRKTQKVMIAINVKKIFMRSEKRLRIFS